MLDLPKNLIETSVLFTWVKCQHHFLNELFFLQSRFTHHAKGNRWSLQAESLARRSNYVEEMHRNSQLLMPKTCSALVRCVLGPPSPLFGIVVLCYNNLQGHSFSLCCHSGSHWKGYPVNWCVRPPPPPPPVSPLVQLVVWRSQTHRKPADEEAWL